MTRKNKIRLLLWFLLSFIGVFTFEVITVHFWGVKGRPPKSWEEINEDLPLYIILSVIFALIMTIRAYFNPLDKEE